MASHDLHSTRSGPTVALEMMRALLGGVQTAAAPEALRDGLRALVLCLLVVRCAEARGLLPADTLAQLRGCDSAWALVRRLGAPDARAQIQVSDDSLRRALDAMPRGSLDIAQLGAACEALVGFEVARTDGPAVCLAPQEAVVSLGALLAEPPDQRARWLRAQAGLRLTRPEAAAVAAATTRQDAADALARRRTPALLPAGTLHLQPGGGRRRSGSHYTPRDVTAPLVADVLRPLLAAQPTPAQILDRAVCDPAMGAGAFLLEACRQLADALVDAWRHHGGGPDTAPRRRARRLVAQRCLYGVDRSPTATTVARLSLWLLCGDPALPPAALANNLQHGDALVGLSRAEIAAFCPDARAAPDQRRAADLCVAAFFDGDGKRARAALRRRYRALCDNPEAAEAIIARQRIQPLHWPLAFPAVFSRPDPGFDAIVGNPPFRNAVEAATARDAVAAAYFRQAFPTFAQGAYDYCLLFWARLDALLRSTGRYGMISPTVLLSSTKPWQRWMHQHLRPDGLILLPVDRFEDARIRTVGIVGGRGAARRYRVSNHDDTRPQASFARDWDPLAASWYEATRPDAIQLRGAPLDIVPLSAMATISAGCTTSVAYTLRPLVADDPEGAGPKLVTTGAIDRYVSKWGRMTVRYLRGDFDHPRWPAGPSVPRGVARARDAQRGAKILVGGLTAVIEAWLDDEGEAAGTVQTWVLRPHAPALRFALLGLLNSATFTRLFMQKFGAGAMSGAQTTIKKADLAAAPLPRLLPGAEDTSIEALFDRDVPFERLPAPVLQAALARAAAALQVEPRSKVDDLAHLLAARLFGRSLDEAEDDYRVWAARERRTETPTPLDTMRCDPAIRDALLGAGSGTMGWR